MRGKAKLTWSQVREIRLRYTVERGLSVTGLAAEYRVAPSTMSSLLSNTTWQDPKYTPPVHPYVHPRAVLTWEKVAEIRERYVRGDVSQTALAKEYGLGTATVQRLVNNISWQDSDYVPPSR